MHPHRKASRFALALVLGACSPPPPPPVAQSAPAPTSEAAPRPMPTAGAAVSAAPPAESDVPATEAPDAAAPAAQDRFVDLNAWLSERGVSQADRQKLKYVYMSCEERTVGDPREAALYCQSWESVDQGQGTARVFRTRVRDGLHVVRAKHVVVVLDAVVAVTVTDKEEEDQGDIVNLQLRLAADGMSAELGDADAAPGAAHQPQSCDDARRALGARVKQPDATAWDRFDLALTQKACAARGTYRWKRGRFVRVPNASLHGTTSGP